jgi:hypothetical protein
MLFVLVVFGISHNLVLVVTIWILIPGHTLLAQDKANDLLKTNFNLVLDE